MKLIQRKHSNNSSLILFGFTLAGFLLTRFNPSQRLLVAAESNDGLSSYFSSARQLFSTGLDAHNSARTYSSLMPNEDPRTTQMLRDTMDKTSRLIDRYQQNGLTNLPALPNVMGLNTIMRIPDKLLRAELSMLQDGIRMAEEMRERPIQATMNTPRELTTMFLRMMQQLNQ